MTDQFPDSQPNFVSDSENESDENPTIDIEVDTSDINISLANSFPIDPRVWLENNRHRSQNTSDQDAFMAGPPFIGIIPPQDSQPEESPETPNQPESATSTPEQRERHLYANPNRWSLYVHGSNDKNLESFKKFLDDDFLVKSELEVLREFLIMNLAAIAEKINERNNLIIDTGSSPTTREENERLQELQARYADGDY